MQRILTIVFFVSVPVLFVGCGKNGVPDDLKNLTPVTIAVTDGSTPVEGVLVSLCRKGAQGAYACNALTDATGVAVIQTTRNSHSVPGVPVGTYSVRLAKTVELPPDLMPQESDQDLPPATVAAKQAKIDTFLKANQSIPEALASSESLMELDVDATDTTLTVDLAKYREQ